MSFELHISTIFVLVDVLGKRYSAFYSGIKPVDMFPCFVQKNTYLLQFYQLQSGQPEKAARASANAFETLVLRDAPSFSTSGYKYG